MPWLRLSLLALLGLSLVLAQEVYRPEVELVRKDKRVVAWVSGEEGSLFYADYGDLHVGELVALAEDRAVVGERAFFLDAGSVLEEGLSPGDRVEAAYNKDLLREGLPYLMRLRRAGEEGAKTYLRLVLYDPKGVEVRLGEEVKARGPLALVERGGREELLLSGGEARFLEEEGRLEVLTPYELRRVEGDERVRWAVVFHNQTQEELALEVDAVLILAGYITKLGPLANWGLALEKNKIKVDTTMATSIPGVYACGDIVTYPGKLPLIVLGFGEAAIAANHAAAYANPALKVNPGHSSEKAAPGT